MPWDQNAISLGLTRVELLPGWPASMERVCGARTQGRFESGSIKFEEERDSRG